MAAMLKSEIGQGGGGGEEVEMKRVDSPTEVMESAGSSPVRVAGAGVHLSPEKEKKTNCFPKDTKVLLYTACTYTCTYIPWLSQYMILHIPVYDSTHPST